MESRPTTGLPASVAPVSSQVRRKNEFHPGDIFPFKRWRCLPSFSAAALSVALSLGTVLVGLGGLVVTAALFVPVGALKSVAGAVARLNRKLRRPAAAENARRRCVVITGASSGIGAALALEYATLDTHLVLIARDEARLKEVASRAKSKGSTASTHSVDFFQPENLAKLHQLLQEVDAKAEGIDVAIACASVTGHRSDVLGETVEHVAAGDNSAQANGVPSQDTAEDGSVWGAITASRVLQVNVAANQEFILRSWELMKARKRDGNSDSSLSPKIIVISSSTAFFTPATFALYAASKAYLYSFTRSLRIASVPYGIDVITVTPGFMETGMTATMQEAGATSPEAILGDPRKIANKIKRTEEGGGQDVVFYPVSQVWALWSLRGLNPLLETFGLWLASATGVAGWFFS